MNIKWFFEMASGKRRRNEKGCGMMADHECFYCKHHTTGKCDTFCDYGESFVLRKDIALKIPKEMLLNRAYESPIKMIRDAVLSEVELDTEKCIMKAVRKYAIDVDKDELLKALKYDRGQYEKGYADGLNANKWIPCSGCVDCIHKECEHHGEVL